MKYPLNRGIIRAKVSTMPRNQSEAYSQLELYKLVTEQQRIKKEMRFIEQRNVILKQRLITLNAQIEETEKNIRTIRNTDSKVSLYPRPNTFYQSKNYQSFEIEY